MQRESVFLEKRGFVGEITINRPDAMNALDYDAMLKLNQRLTECRDDDGIRAIVITGAGERAFCVGSDLKRQVPTDVGYAQMAVLPDRLSAERGNYVRLLMFNHLQLWKPVVAAVNGFCLGGGLEILLQTDVRVAGEASSFGLPEAKVGSFPGICGVPMLMRQVPRAVAMRMMLTGSRLSAKEALACGLVNEVCDAGDVLGRARDMASEMAECGPLAVQAIKRVALASNDLSTDAMYEISEQYFGILKNSEDRIEGRKAFAEKRKPMFVGR